MYLVHYDDKKSERKMYNQTGIFVEFEISFFYFLEISRQLVNHTNINFNIVF